MIFIVINKQNLLHLVWYFKFCWLRRLYELLYYFCALVQKEHTAYSMDLYSKLFCKNEKAEDH